MKDFFRRLLNSLTSHIILKLVSIVLAVIIWSYIIAVTPSLTRSKYVTDLSVSVSGESALNNYGLAVSTDVYMEYLHKISATVDVSQSQLSKVTNKNVVVTADVSNIRTVGTHEVPLKAISVYGEVMRLYPETVSVEIESLDSRDMPIEVSLTGMDNEHYWYNVLTETINPQQVTLSGPVSVIQNVVSVGAKIDVTAVTSDIRRGVTLAMLDASDNPIISRKLNKSATTCSVRVEVLPKKEFALSIDESQVKVADGYQIDAIRFQPSSIVVAADSALLSTLDHLPLQLPETTPELSQSATIRVSVADLNEFKYISAKQVFMTIVVSEVKDNVTLTDIPISVYGLNADKYSVSISPSVFSAQVSLPRSLAENLDANDLNAYVDVTDLTEGNFELPIVIGSNSDISLVSLTPSFIEVQITVAEETNDRE